VANAIMVIRWNIRTKSNGCLTLPEKQWSNDSDEKVVGQEFINYPCTQVWERKEN